MTDCPKPPATQRAERDPQAFQEALLEWFRKEGRAYPWRQTRDPYAILVSEIMLQQTQIKTVLQGGYYERWMARFPDVEALARAPEDAVLKAWEGLGYYRRARHLHRLAKEVHQDHAGRLPKSLDGLLALPGIGRYTAGAVCSFAYDLPEAVVDGNVLRVFARLFDYWEPVDRGPGEKQMWAWADSLMPRQEPRLYNSALMELGQSLCRKAQPLCSQCPVSAFCQSASPEELPKKRPPRATVFQDEHTVFHLKAGRLWLCQEQNGRREGLWKLPPCPVEWKDQLPLVYKAKYSITHHRVTLHVYESGCSEFPLDEACGVSLEEVGSIAMAAPYRKAVQRLLKDGEEFRLEG